jgi:hypothetical protein
MSGFQRWQGLSRDFSGDCPDLSGALANRDVKGDENTRLNYDSKRSQRNKNPEQIVIHGHSRRCCCFP